MDVAVDATTWGNERGFGRFTRELVAALAARSEGFRYTLILDEEPRFPVPSSVAVERVDTQRSVTRSAVGKGARGLRDTAEIIRRVLGTRCDVFFFPAVYSFFPIPWRKPTVVCFHDTIAERFPHLVFPTLPNRLLWQAKTALARQQATRAMTVSEASARDLERVLKIPRSRIDVVTEGPDPVFRVLEDGAEFAARTRRDLEIPLDASLFVYVGGLNPHKNLLSLLRAMTQAVQQETTIHLAVVGDTSGKGFFDNVEALRRFVAQHPEMEPHVHFTGYLPDEKLVELFQTATALVLPSLWEGFGLPAVEAMASGVPVLASRRGSLPEVVDDAGLFFEPEDAHQISSHLVRVHRDTELRAQLRERALARAQTFTWARGAELAEMSFRRAVER